MVSVLNVFTIQQQTPSIEDTLTIVNVFTNTNSLNRGHSLNSSIEEEAPETEVFIHYGESWTVLQVAQKHMHFKPEYNKAYIDQ